MPKIPFSAYRSQGYRLDCFHEIGRAQCGYLTHKTKPPLYAVRFRSRQAAADTLRKAINQLRAQLPSR